MILVWLAVGMFCAACGRNNNVPKTETQSGVKLNWLTDFEAARAESRTTEKMLLLNFTGSDWCPFCIQLEKQVFSQPEFADYATKNLVLLKADFPRRKVQSDGEKAANENLADQFGIEAFPTIVVLGPGGKTLGELGYMPGGPEKFIAALEKLRATK
jgi:protein disulfide-isomerase